MFLCIWGFLFQCLGLNFEPHTCHTSVQPLSYSPVPYMVLLHFSSGFQGIRVITHGGKLLL